jgi:hypothetical protein
MARIAYGSTLDADGFETATILGESADGLTRIVTRSSWHERESAPVEAYEAELLVLEQWAEFHRRVLGFDPTWESYVC